jgi:hypothetical protein
MHAAVVPSHFPPEWATGVTAPPRMKTATLGYRWPLCQRLRRGPPRWRWSRQFDCGLAPAALQLTAYRNETPPRIPPRAKSGSQRPPVPRSRATCGLLGGYRKGIASMLVRPPEWRKRLSPTMRQTHVAGDKLFVDWAGETVPVIDPMTGEVHDAHLFAGPAALQLTAYRDERPPRLRPRGQVRFAAPFGPQG